MIEKNDVMYEDITHTYRLLKDVYRNSPEATEATARHISNMCDEYLSKTTNHNDFKNVADVTSIDWMVRTYI